MLRIASFLVPHSGRQEWLREWKGELWYQWDTNRFQSSSWLANHCSSLHFCLGAFKDAAWLRRNAPEPECLRGQWLSSPVRCISFLSALAAVSVSLSFYLPGPHDALWQEPFHEEGNLVLLSAVVGDSRTAPSVSFQRYREMERRLRRDFTEMAFYRPTLQSMHTQQHQQVPFRIAVTSEKFLRLLNVPMPATDCGAGVCAKLLLSLSAWQKYFDSNPHIDGRVVEMEGRPIMVAGVDAGGLSHIPGGADGWLIENEKEFATMGPRSKGFVVGRSTLLASVHAKGALWHFSMENDAGRDNAFQCEPLVERRPLLPQLFIVGIALFILPIFTRLELGEYPSNVTACFKGIRSRRWIFLGLKVALILPVVFLGTIDLAPGIGSIQPLLALIGYVFGFRWILIDQRQRCPVCLRLLTNPARIGQRASSLLEWYGTELMCTRGHGLLHISEASTISFGTQRWIDLDQSWRPLFYR